MVHLGRRRLRCRKWNGHLQRCTGSRRGCTNCNSRDRRTSSPDRTGGNRLVEHTEKSFREFRALTAEREVHVSCIQFTGRQPNRRDRNRNGNAACGHDAGLDDRLRLDLSIHHLHAQRCFKREFVLSSYNRNGERGGKCNLSPTESSQRIGRRIGVRFNIRFHNDRSVHILRKPYNAEFR